MNKREWLWDKVKKIGGTPIAITFVGILGSVIVVCTQISSTEKIANKDREIKIWEVFAQNAVTTTDIGGRASSITLLSLLSRQSQDEKVKTLSQNLFMASLNIAMKQLQSDFSEEERKIAGNLLVQLFYSEDSLITSRLIDEIIIEETPDAQRTNYDIIRILYLSNKTGISQEQSDKLNFLSSHSYIKNDPQKYGRYLESVLSRKH